MADWQDEPATERQQSYAESLGVSLPKGTTKGEASGIISSALERREDRQSTRIVIGGQRSLGQRLTDGIALLVAIIGWSVAAILALVALGIGISGSYIAAGLVAMLALAVGLAGSWGRRGRTSVDQGIGPSEPSKVHAKRGTYDSSYFTNPKTGRFQFPKYKKDNRFLVQITDETDYTDIREMLDPDEWREYTVRDFEEEVVPEIEVEPFSQLFYKSNTEHLQPLGYLKGQWGLVEKLVDLDENDWLIFDPESKPMSRLLKEGYLLTWQPTSMQDKRSYLAAFKTDRLRQACKAAGIKGGQRKAEIIDRMIEAECEFDLPPAVVPAPRFHEWLEGLVRTYIEHLRENADRFHPLYHPEIWENALDQAELPPVKHAVGEVYESRYWMDRLE